MTCIVCKSTEHIIYSQIMNHLDKHDILVEFKHRFRGNHSCETPLLNTFHDLSRRLDRRKGTDLLILDFRPSIQPPPPPPPPNRSFPHKIQLNGVRGKPYRWISSWLCHRQHRVVLGGSASSDSPVLSGVPQGTVLGPLMFLLYVNDIGTNVSPQTTTKLFSDDCLLYRTIDPVADINQL